MEEKKTTRVKKEAPAKAKSVTKVSAEPKEVAPAGAEAQEIVIFKEISDAVLDSDLHDFAVLDDYIQVHEEGRKYKTLLTKKFMERKKWSAPDPNQIRAHIPGVVGDILVKKGDNVKKGDKLMIYEAMKMKNVITAPFDGVIRKICVKEEDRLPKGALLIIMRNKLQLKLKKSK